MKSLEELRSEIDNLDHQILALVQKRISVTTEVQTLKKEKGLPPEDLERETKILNKLSQDFNKIPAALIKDLFSVLFTYSKRTQGPKIESK